MALLTASDLRKEIAGQPLLQGVSFKLERRERITLAGRNGSGKTTLLRMLAGESAIAGGELSLAALARALATGADVLLKDYLLSGCEGSRRIKLAELRAPWPPAGDEQTSPAITAAQGG
jgi:ATP-binding cassette subfamily F protein 3